jgi:mobilization protein NikA
MSQSESRVRTWVMGVRLSAAERAIVQEAAARRGLTVAQLARELLLSEAPRIAPGDTIHVVGPNCDYRVLGLGTHGKGAELQLETVSGKDWINARAAKIPA